MVKNLSKIYFLLVIVCFYLLMCSFGGITFDDFSKQYDNITNQVLAEENIIYWTDDGIRGSEFAGGTGEETDPYLIETPEQLAYLSYQVYNGNKYLNTYFEQIADLDFSGYYWQPIGIYYDRENIQKNKPFAGVYDGGNFTISGIYTPAGSTKAYSYQGVFGLLDNYSEIKNVILKDSLIQGYQYLGGITGGYEYGWSVYSKIENCISYATVIGNDYVGGIVGCLGGYEDEGFTTTIKNCSNYGEIKSDNGDAGGIIGNAYRYIKVENCQNFGRVEGSTVGGVAGYFYYASSILESANYGEVIGSYCAGGICGVADYSFLTDCYNYANVTCSSGAGGIVGQETWSCILTNCYNLGNVSGKNSVGGVVGSASFEIELNNSYNFGEINNSGNYTGGIIGYAGADKIVIVNCFNLGNVKGTDYVGGLVSYVRSSNIMSEIKLDISSSYVEGKVSGGNYVGGLIGSVNIDSYITDCGVNATIITSSNANSNGIVGQADTIEIANVYFIGQFLDVNDNPLLLNNFVSTFNNCKIIDSYIISNEGLQNEFKTKEDTNGFVNWVTVPSINGGNPIQKSLYHIGNLD